jgi:hypothetical protein
MLHVLLGERMKLVRQRLGLNDALLARIVFQERMAHLRASLPPDSDPASAAHMQAAPRYASFLEKQLDPYQHIGGVALRNAAQHRAAAKYVKSRGPRGPRR